MDDCVTCGNTGTLNGQPCPDCYVEWVDAPSTKTNASSKPTRQVIGKGSFTHVAPRPKEDEPD